MTDIVYCEPPPCYVPPPCEPVYCEPPPCEPPPCYEPPQEARGNNGWGNGIDGDNPGTTKGNAEQAGTKQNDFVSVKFSDKFDGR